MGEDKAKAWLVNFTKGNHTTNQEQIMIGFSLAEIETNLKAKKSEIFRITRYTECPIIIKKGLVK